MLRRFTFQICILLGICVLAVVGLVKESIQTQGSVKMTPTVIIDAGHGGLTNTTH